MLWLHIFLKPHPNSLMLWRYARGKYGLPSEYVKFGGNAKDDFTPATDAPFYILRPETAETFFILYHLTKDSVYQEWGWEVFRAIDASCRTEAGFAALRNVQTAQQNNRMESFFPAETLKYLYLLQDNSHQIDLLNTVRVVTMIFSSYRLMLMTLASLFISACV